MATYTIYARDSINATVRYWAWYESSSAVSATLAGAGPANNDSTATTGGGTGQGIQVGTIYKPAAGKIAASWGSDQSFLEFDTSSSNIPAGDTINGVTLNLYTDGSGGQGTTDSLNAYLYAYTDTASTKTDWRTSTQLGLLTKVASNSNAFAASPPALGTNVALSQVGTAFNTGLNRSGLTQVVLASGIQQAGTFSNTVYAYARFTSPMVTNQSYATSTATLVPAANKPNIVVTTTGAATAQTVTPTGIGTSEAWGTAVVGLPQTVTPTGVGTSEAWGAAAVQPAQTVTPTGIGTSETWGAAAVEPAQTVTPTGIGTSETWGSPGVGLQISPTGVSTSEAWGSVAVEPAQTVSPSGIGSGETWGAVAVGQQVAPIGVAASEVWGATAVEPAQTVTPTGVGSGETWGATAVGQQISPAGVATSETWGAAALGQQVAPAGVATSEAWGAAAVEPTQTVAPTGIAATESWGTASIGQQITPTGIGTSEAWGAAAVEPAQTVTPSGVPSSEAWGAPQVMMPQTLTPIGIPTAEAWGSPLAQLAGQSQQLLVQGIGTGEAVGGPQVTVPLASASVGSMVVKTLRSGAWIASTGASQSARRTFGNDTANPYELLLVDASKGPVEVSAPAGLNGMRFGVKKIDPSSNKVTVIASGTSIDGESSFTLTSQWAYKGFISDGASWWTA